MILELDNVELYFKNKRILNGIYLKAETGKITGILGSNGCGKSCLLNILFGALKPKYKHIRIDNQQVKKPLYKLGRISYLPQHYLIPNGLRVKSAFSLYKVGWNKFINYFPTLEYLYNQKLKTLSGGERRLIETFITLRKAADIVLLDEPFSHLAPVYIETLKQLILKEQHNKIIIITDHLFEEIVEISDSLYLLKNGSTTFITNSKQLEDYNYVKPSSMS